jgi:hypothetical protein
MSCTKDPYQHNLCYGTGAGVEVLLTASRRGWKRQIVLGSRLTVRPRESKVW